jgi:hypothetical protein
MFNTLVGSAAKSSSFKPRELATASPVGKPWKKLGTPDATHEGRPDPSPESTLSTSDSTSLKIFRATTGEGLCWIGEAVMTGSAGAALAKAVRAGEAEANERREACTKAREMVDLIFSSIYNS